MAVKFQRGSSASFPIVVRDEFGAPITPFSISYSIFDATQGLPILFGNARQNPSFNGSPGYYCANFQIDGQAPIGIWQIRWYIKRNQNDPGETTIVEEFEVISSLIPALGFEAQLPSYVRELICQLRVILRDNNPDRNYSFRPPEKAAKINNYTERFGFVWESVELYVALKQAVNAINLWPPRTWMRLESFAPNCEGADWQHVLLYKAATIAARMIQANWIVDEFNYSLGPLSLDLSKSDKYASLAEAWDSMFEREVQKAKDTLNYTIGLRQAQFSGVSGLFSFGPSIHKVGLVNFPSLIRG